jgi:DNA-binding XRE family transcriptional regulator
LNIAQFCEKLKISTATYFYLETGVDSGSVKLKQRIADFFGCQISDIFPVEMIGSITKEEYLKRKLEEDKTASTEPDKNTVKPVLF